MENRAGQEDRKQEVQIMHNNTRDGARDTVQNSATVHVLKGSKESGVSTDAGKEINDLIV